MNAYELAKYAESMAKDVGNEGFHRYALTLMFDIPETLCQQADRIAKLEKDVHILERHYDQLDKDVDLKDLSFQNAVNEKMKGNKPVAWQREDGVIAFHEQPQLDSQGFKWRSLYAHPQKELNDEEIIEQLAELEHRQWMMWVTNIVSTEEISKERKDRWFTCMVAYSELSEEMKEHDRVWARQALAIIKSSRGEK